MSRGDVLRWAAVGACGRNISTGEPYSTGVLWSARNTARPGCGQDPTRQDGPGPAQLLLTIFGGKRLTQATAVLVHCQIGRK
jgi:hypothetical protein